MMIILCPSTKILISIYNLLTVPPFFSSPYGLCKSVGPPRCFHDHKPERGDGQQKHNDGQQKRNDDQ